VPARFKKVPHPLRRSSYATMCGEAKVNAVIIGSGEPPILVQCATEGACLGIFGMSTALWMLEDGGYDVTVLDKCGILPAPDAASTGQWSCIGDQS